MREVSAGTSPTLHGDRRYLGNPFCLHLERRPVAISPAFALQGVPEDAIGHLIRSLDRPKLVLHKVTPRVAHDPLIRDPNLLPQPSPISLGRCIAALAVAARWEIAEE